MNILAALIVAALSSIPLAQDPVPPALAGLELRHENGTYEFGCRESAMSEIICIYLPASDWFIVEWGGCVEKEVHLGSINYTCVVNPLSNCWIRFQHVTTGERRTYGKTWCDGSAVMRVEGSNWHVHYDWVIYNPAAPSGTF